MLAPKQKCRTSVKRATLNPKWDKAEDLPMIATTVRSAGDLREHCIMLHVFDSDLTSKDDYLGSGCVSLGK
jgi:Ca2+-dependent lipid-binding protein